MVDPRTADWNKTSALLRIYWLSNALNNKDPQILIYCGIYNIVRYCATPLKY
jgi:hypothetical protein